jgi:hypothetical protein
MVAHRKPEEQRQDNSPGRALATVTEINGGRSAAGMAHAPAAGWLKPTRDAWDDFWLADVAKMLAPHHMPTVYRLFELRDAQTRMLRVFKKCPMVEGSMKQPVVNPAMATVQALEKDIRALEDRLGLTPKAQASLGIKIGEARLTAAELNRMAAEEGSGDSDGGDAGSDGVPDDVLEAEWVEA